MAATSLSILIGNISYDTGVSKYFATWFSVDDENNTDSGYTFYTIGELVATINARVTQNAKDSHNLAYGTPFGALTPTKLIGGLV